ncbi:MAG TPA: SDR family oxidoreductase [Chroococcales cyanobacterium]
MASKVVVVTGASAGLGRAIALEFARNNFDVGLVARNEEALNEVKQQIETIGRKAVVCPADVSDARALEEAAQSVESQLGEIDVWVNNAMVSVFSPVSLMQPEEYKRVTEVTYLGYVYGTLAALRLMKRRNRGTIVQVGSALAHRAIPLQSAYCAAKHAIKGFTESLICELLHEKSQVKVSMVHMPALNTPQFRWVKSRLPKQPQPVPPIFQPEVGARAVVWAAGHGPRELLVGYPTMKAVVGEKFVPGYIDKVLAETGYKDQQTNEAVADDRINNLWKPAPNRYYSEHGDFSHAARAKGLSMTNRQVIGLGFLGALCLGTLSVGLANRVRKSA